MDMRVVKTKRDIRAAFYQLRAKMPLEKIKVVDICSEALISKPTFYKHYQDVYALSDELEDELIREFMDSFTEKDCLLTDPARFLHGLETTMGTLVERFKILYRDRMNHPPKKIMDTLRAYYTRPGQSPQEEILYTFVLSGMMFVGFYHRVPPPEAKNPNCRGSIYDQATIDQCLNNILAALRTLRGEEQAQE